MIKEKELQKKIRVETLKLGTQNLERTTSVGEVSPAGHWQLVLHPDMSHCPTMQKITKDTEFQEKVRNIALMMSAQNFLRRRQIQ